MLSDRTIIRNVNNEHVSPSQQISVNPAPCPSQFQAASLDLTLGEVATEALRITPEDTYWCLEAGQFLLASTEETIGLGSQIAARVEGKSTWGRRGLLIHAAGFIDPGFIGQITLELKNLSHRPIHLYKDAIICQLAFFLLDAPAMSPYAGKYQNQRGPTPAKEW